MLSLLFCFHRFLYFLDARIIRHFLDYKSDILKTLLLIGIPVFVTPEGTTVVNGLEVFPLEADFRYSFSRFH